MTRVIWTREAVEDVEDVEAIKAHVARDSVRYAALLAERIVAAVGRHESFPESGRVVPEVGDESLREIIHGACRIVYRIQAGSVQVVTFPHAGGCWVRSQSTEPPGQRLNNAVNAAVPW